RRALPAGRPVVLAGRLRPGDLRRCRRPTHRVRRAAADVEVDDAPLSDRRGREPRRPGRDGLVVPRREVGRGDRRRRPGSGQRGADQGLDDRVLGGDAPVLDGRRLRQLPDGRGPGAGAGDVPGELRPARADQAPLRPGQRLPREPKHRSQLVAASLTWGEQPVPPTTRVLAVDGFSTEVTVRFAETDAQGIAHNANYLVWYEVARIDWLARYAGGYRRIQEAGYEALTTESHVRYAAPAYFDDRLRMHARCGELRG